MNFSEKTKKVLPKMKNSAYAIFMAKSTQKPEILTHDWSILSCKSNKFNRKKVKSNIKSVIKKTHCINSQLSDHIHCNAFFDLNYNTLHICPWHQTNLQKVI